MLYKPTKVVVACAQRDQLKSQIEANSLPIKINLKDITPADTLLLTRGQISRLEKAKELGQQKYKTIRMSRKQIEKNRLYHGGFLNLLNKQEEDFGSDNTKVAPFLDEQDDGIYLVKQGHSMKVYPVQDNGLYLKEHSTPKDEFQDDGVYIKRGSVIENGAEIVFNQNLPILGYIL